MGVGKFLFTLSALTFMVCAAEKAGAQVKSERLNRLSEAKVTAFIEDTAILTSQQNLERNDADIISYLNKHIDKKARFKTNITYMMPGLPAQTKTLSLKKRDYIDQVLKGAQDVEHYNSEVQVDKVSIASNKKTASVNTTTIESGIMQIRGPDGVSQEVPIEGVSECFQILKLGKNGYIQMYSANCTTKMRFLAE
jgi:hypothetical protein